ncbi:MAG TPA: inorganic phosphate transporter [Phycisphaerales bacterium]|jgi:phosphate/sulfate permease|nr:inorganic phosphate transporter [Phycisphaerales bacterium]HIO20025.1 inorganic phosphate transporter [Phycisphaerales bacterium]
MEYATPLIILALVFGFYMAWNIGANDVANAMGTSVGSGALTFKQAVIIAAILEFAGAFFVGSHVSDTVRKGIVDPMLFTGDPQAFVLGMLSALLAAGVWLQIATMFGWPVSTTHSIVGALIGFGIVYGGMSVIQWDKVGTIAASWIISPLMSATISFIIFQIVLRKVFYKADPVAAVRKFAPYMVFLVLAIMTLVMVFKGLKNLHLDLSITNALLVSAGVGLIGAVTTIILLRNYKSDESDEEQLQSRELYVARTLQQANKHLLRAKDGADADTRASIDAIIKQTEAATDTSTKRANLGSSRQEFRRTERIFVFLQILTACFIAFAHGANDVANAIGPLSAAVQTVQDGIVATEATVPLWALLVGGVGIVIGLATYGWKVMETVGKKITELTPSRGFCAMFGAATTVVIASKLALPISTTHTLVGAVLGVGLARGIGALNLAIVRDIAISWVITIPAGALLAIIFYKTLGLIF